jgi:hypothetical protein
MSQEIQVEDYVVKTSPPHAYYKGPPKAVYKVMRIVRSHNVRCARVSRCSFTTLTVVPGSKFLLFPVERLTRLDPLEVMARWGRPESPTNPNSG